MGDILLTAGGAALMIVGLVGCVLPVIPGPPLSFVGLLLLHFSKYAEFSFEFLMIFGSIAVIVTVLDYIVPIWGTKKFGGSKAGMWGAAIGLVIGIFVLPPLGIIVGPFAGAVIGEALTGKKAAEAFRAGLGSLLGLMMGVGLKLAASLA
ncbi:MAG: DUF456 domain-containing protein, partial [Bacteroidales bacterium]|nr:DUF456 domain-containing protein [Bacteroidales bacterium]